MSTNAYGLQYAQDGSMLHVAHLKRRICWITAEESKKFPMRKKRFFFGSAVSKSPKKQQQFHAFAECWVFLLFPLTNTY